MLSSISWFHGKISGPEAVCKLQPAEDGLFLVRESIRHPGDYVLCVSVSGVVIHYRVIYQDSKLTIDNTQYFYNLIDMIEVRENELAVPAWGLKESSCRVHMNVSEERGESERFREGISDRRTFTSEVYREGK